MELTRKIFITLLLQICIVVFVQAQDLLILKNQTEYQVSIVQILPNDILFKAWESYDTATYSISKADVAAIVFSNGQKVTFNNEVVSPPVQQNNEFYSPPVNQDPPQSPYSTRPAQVPMPNYNTDSPTPEKSKSSGSKSGISPSGIQLYFGTTINGLLNRNVPFISFVMDGVTRSGISINTGICTGFDKYFGDNYEIKSFTNWYMLGMNYYLNRAFKFKTTRPAIYFGAYAYLRHDIFSYSSYLSEEVTEKFSELSFAGSAKFGLSYNIAKKFGLFGEVHYGTEKIPSYVAGIRISGRYDSVK
jgi:hypothetical protein